MLDLYPTTLSWEKTNFLQSLPASDNTAVIGDYHHAINTAMRWNTKTLRKIFCGALWTPYGNWEQDDSIGANSNEPKWGTSCSDGRWLVLSNHIRLVDNSERER